MIDYIYIKKNPITWSMNFEHFFSKQELTYDTFTYVLKRITMLIFSKGMNAFGEWKLNF